MGCMADMESVCRACLEPEATESLRAPWAVGAAATLLELLDSLTQLQCSEAWMPQAVCPVCAECLRSAHHLKQTYYHSYRTLVKRHTQNPKRRADTRLCRMCLRFSATESLYEWRATENSFFTFSELMSSLTHIEHSDSWLPQNVCLTCSERLNSSYKFKQTCISSHRKLTIDHAVNQNTTTSHPIVPSKFAESIRILPKTLKPQFIVPQNIDSDKPPESSSKVFNPVYNCNVCAKTFITHFFLQAHLRTHAYCYLCEKAFSSVAALTKHNHEYHFVRKKSDRNETSTSVGALTSHGGAGDAGPIIANVNENIVTIDRNHVQSPQFTTKDVLTDKMMVLNNSVQFNAIQNYSSEKFINIGVSQGSNNITDELFNEPDLDEHYEVITETMDEDFKDSKEGATDEMHSVLELITDYHPKTEDIGHMTVEMENPSEDIDFEEADASAEEDRSDESKEPEDLDSPTVHYFVVDDEDAENLVEITVEQASLLVSGETLQPVENTQRGLLTERPLVLDSVGGGGEADVFQCGVCGVTFPHRYSLRRHLAGAHGMYTLSCRYCHTRFNDPKLFKAHKKALCKSTTPQESTAASKPAHFECPICHKKFAHRAPMVAHSRAAHGVCPLYRCDICGKQLKTRAGFDYHARTHGGYPRFACERCGRRFTTRATLRHHVAARHTERRPHLCQQCGRGFVSADHLRKHLRLTHGGRRDHLCATCGLAFQQASHVRQHQWVHTGVKPHPCQYCGGRYSSRAALKKHHLRLHGAEWERDSAALEAEYRRREREELHAAVPACRRGLVLAEKFEESEEDVDADLPGG